MTQDFFLGQLRLILVAVCAYGAGAGWLSTSQNTFVGAISVPLIALFGPWLWSIYVNINTKLVPSDSVAISKSDVQGAAVKGTTVAVPADTVKVVG